MIVFENRASAIIYNFLRSNRSPGKFILPANVCPIVPLAFMKSGTEFEFVDIHESTLCMDFAEALRLLREKPREYYSGVLFVHTYGAEQRCDQFFGEVKSVSDELLIIDDRCLCMPSLRPAATLPADITLYSTGKGKCVDAGYGGYAAVAEAVGYSRGETLFTEQALKSIEAQYRAALSDKTRFCYVDSDWLCTGNPTESFEEFIGRVGALTRTVQEHKRQLNEIYATGLPKEIQLPGGYQNWRFNIVVPERDRLLADIFEAGLFASAHYQSLAGVFSENAPVPRAKRLQDNVLNLFNDQHFTSDMARRVTLLVLDHLKTTGQPQFN